MTVYVRASEVASALALDKRRSRLALFLQKQGKLPESDEDNVAMEEGREFEDAIARIAARKYQLELVESPVEELRAGHLIGHPDRCVIDPDTNQHAILEIKHTFLHQDVDNGEWGAPGTDRVPTPYWVQTAVYQHLLAERAKGMPADRGFQAAPFAHLAARLASGTKLYRIEPGKELMDCILAEVAEFVRRVELDDPPAPTDEAEMRLRWLVQRDKVHEADAELLHFVRAYKNLGEDIAKAEAQRSDLRTMILGRIQDAGKVVAKHPKTGALVPILGAGANQVFDAAAFEASEPALAAQYQTLDRARLRKEQARAYEAYVRPAEGIAEQVRVLRVLRDLKVFEE